MYEFEKAAASPDATSGCHMIRQARHLPDLFERAAGIFRETSGASYALLYLAVSDDDAVELSYAGYPPPRSRELSWRGSHDPRQMPWQALEASEILLIEHQGRPFALVALGPSELPRSVSQIQALQALCHATREVLEQALLQTRALAADFQEQRANRHHHQAKFLGERLRQVSHDLRNQLVPMLYATEELQELLSAPDALKLLVNLERQIRLADQLSKQSLHALDRPKPSERSDLVAIARQQGEDWRRAFQKRRLSFALELPEAPVWVDGSSTQHHQVLGNLLSNALKFTSPGGQIRLRLTPHADYCLLEVSDTGRGIGLNIRRRLFEAHVREDPEVEGHGLGLNNVQAILRELGGSITLESQPGRGSSFQIRLATHAEDALLPSIP